MASMDVFLDLAFAGDDTPSEICLSIDFSYRPGSPASYEHPGDPPEMELETIFWPIEKWDAEKRAYVSDHIEMDPRAIPRTIMEKIEQHIRENYEPREDGPDDER